MIQNLLAKFQNFSISKELVSKPNTEGLWNEIKNVVKDLIKNLFTKRFASKIQDNISTLNLLQ